MNQIYRQSNSSINTKHGFLFITYLIFYDYFYKICKCASTNLKGRWGLTGFTQTFRDQSFTATCASGSDTDHYVTCSGYCMSYLFQDPDLTKLMVVRGCHAVDDQTSDVSYCEYDKDLERVDSQGNTVYVKALVEFCSGLVLANLFAIHKACSDINLFGNGHGCATSDLVTIPGNLVKLNGEITHCFCNDKDYCNGTNTVTLHVIVISLSFMFLMQQH
ncbi:unnamed protein product [Thelazia callipaeda]|uniref:Protein sleepless n=1 Tax=Thelazia callipaeda TaxID=103827 RepID=A0A0N5CWC8_THECL|nr:unnamed protein product [Thelazia callipaeda]